MQSNSLKCRMRLSFQNFYFSNSSLPTVLLIHVLSHHLKDHLQDCMLKKAFVKLFSFGG